MASVDDRIVQMQFDNASFEKKLDDTIKSLDNLTKALKFEGAQKGFSDIQASGDKFNLGGMGVHIDGVSAKFLAMSTIAITALSNITTKAMQTGEQVIKSLSLQPLIDGFHEYETNINSIQTILANTKTQGTNLDDVTASLDELNHYADKTIYNFTQMTRNIGTFTAAGIDLKTSTASIEGIANLAAISGSNADQASTAMYQLSQAMASGTVKLMDWNSVVNAGMGGQVFQNALFESGKALGTLKDVPVGQTFTQWKDAGNSFRDSLKDGWATTDVLTTTLQAFGGQMTEDQLIAKGFSKDVAAQFIELGKTGLDSATSVRTFTALLGTVKEAIGSGWTQTFTILIGNFTEATALFTGLSNTIGKMVGDSANARNEILQGWKDMGGRDLLLEGLRTGLQSLGEVIKPIKDAFREIFPKKTMFDLMEMTKSFELLMIKMKPSGKTIEEIHSIFKGFFSTLQIGWEILKDGVKFVAGLFSAFGAGSGSFLSFAAKIGDFFTELNNKLIEGEGIKKFFENLATAAQLPIAFIKDLAGAIKDFFAGIGNSAAADVATGAVDRISGRFDNLKQVFEQLSGLWEPVKNGLEKIFGILDKVWSAIRNWFADLGKKLAAVMQPGDFNSVVDAVNVGLLGAIALLLKKFLDKGLKLDFGDGFLSSIKKSFEGLTGVLSAMQTQLKAGALEKIAIAIGILTASVLVLSMIDSAALTKALSAMAVGFTELMASFAVLNKVDTGITSGATFNLIATGMILLSTALLILSAAVKVLSTMGWEDLTKGLLGITVLLTVLTVASGPLSDASIGLIAAGVGMEAISVALTILAVALKIFATMSWEEIGKGLAAVAALLLAIGVAMNLMPADMVLTGPGLVAVATGMVILGAAMKIFATLSWEEIGKGLVSIAGALVAIGVAMNLMPISLPITAAGLVLVSVSLIAIGEAMRIMGGLSWKEIGKGLTSMAGSLLILAVATDAMTGSIAGAVAIGIVSGSLFLLAKVLKEFGAISWNDLTHGLVGIAATLTVLAGAAFLMQAAVVPLLGFGAALLLIGGGFALFGVGVMTVAKGLEILVKIGTSAIQMLPDLIRAIGKGIPALMQGLAEGLLEMLQTFTDAAPVIVKSLVVIIGHILDGLVQLIPKALVVMAQLIDGLIKYVATDGGPKLIQAGIDLLLALLKGIRDNIGEVVIVVADIIKNFLDAFAAEIPGITTSIANFIVAVFLGVANAIGLIAGQLLFGIGIAFITGLMNGIEQSAASGPLKWFMELAGKIIGWVGDVVKTLWQKGADFVIGLLTGISDNIIDVKNFFIDLPGNLIGWVGDVTKKLWQTGWDLIQGMWHGIEERIGDLINWMTSIPGKIIGAIPNPLDMLVDIGKKIIQGLWDGMKATWKFVADWVTGLGGWIIGNKGPASKDKLLLVENGMLIMQGLQKGMEDEWDNVAKWLNEVNPAEAMDRNLSSNMTKILSGVSDQLGSMEEFNPTITPVLDLTQVQVGAKKIGDYIASSQTLAGSSAYAQAAMIAAAPSNIIAQQYESDIVPVAPGGINFEQNIYAPSQLSTSDIYKQTRNQITMAKEELSIP